MIHAGPGSYWVPRGCEGSATISGAGGRPTRSDGPWQLFGRSDIPFEDMIKLDYMYVSTWSPRGD